MNKDSLLAASYITNGDSKLLYKMHEAGLLEDVFGGDLMVLTSLHVGRDRIKGMQRRLAGFSVEEYREVIHRLGVKLHILGGDDYPLMLKEIYQPPFVLYAKGELVKEDALSVAVVGTRKPTIYGRRHTRELSKGLAGSGVTVVSGMAIGLDTLAHQAALESGGRTIAVLAGGLGVAMTERQKKLAEYFSATGRGVLVSEYPMGLKPAPYQFPVRNRIIAGLSRATVVVEGALGSGALITAVNANEEGRLVFAVPGSIDSSKSKGPHTLLKKGTAMIAEGVQDILDELGIDYQAPIDKLVLDISNDVEQRIMESLSAEPLDVSELILSTGKEAKEIHASITILQIKGLVKSAGGGRWTRID